MIYLFIFVLLKKNIYVNVHKGISGTFAYFLHVYDSKFHTEEVFLDYFAQSFNVPLGGVQSVIYSIFCRLPIECEIVLKVDISI